MGVSEGATSAPLAYSELQRLAKEHGLKANQKADKLRAQLVELGVLDERCADCAHGALSVRDHDAGAPSLHCCCRLRQP